MKYISFFLPILLCTHVTGATLNSHNKNHDHKINDLDNHINVYLKKNCSEKKPPLCEILNNFSTGSVPESLPQKHHVSTINTSNKIFYSSIGFDRTFALMYTKEAKGTINISFTNLVAENSNEITEIQSYISSLSKTEISKKTAKTKLGEYIVKNTNSQQYFPCNIQNNALACTQDNSKYRVIYLRRNGDSLYAIILNKIAKIPGSWDRLPGFFIVEFKDQLAEPAT